MPIGSIAGIAAALPTLPTLPTVPTQGAGAVGQAANPGSSFAGALDNLAQVQNKADNLAVQAATGDLTDVQDYLISATQASLATEMTVAVRNKALESFNSIMNMAV